MPIYTKIGKKSQIVIPKNIRNAAGISEGDELIIEVIDDKIVLRQKPDSYSKKLKGLYKDLWKNIDAKEYVKRERESW
ncbi:MAG: AbrB/MazE/SpoVT family DNA-binding domain-containing protein [Candidatus Marinimicrobia bacterium]|nr:AbrB/MazE/SpoVT family DNA-binding domain-containing protein [Candidatus Neomarinimicrobiota bacterium]